MGSSKVNQISIVLLSINFRISHWRSCHDIFVKFCGFVKLAVCLVKEKAKNLFCFGAEVFCCFLCFSVVAAAVSNLRGARSPQLQLVAGRKR